MFRGQGTHCHTKREGGKKKPPVATTLEETNLHVNPSVGGIFWNDIL